MKKFISTLTASVMAVSSLAVLSSSALDIESENNLSVSTSTVESDVITESGAVIPAGAVAVTVNIDGNTGFNHSATKLEIGSDADVVVDEYGRPVVTKGDVLNDFIAASAVKNGTVVISSASSSETSEDGEMFTFYVSDNYSGVSVTDISDVSVCISNDSVQSLNSGQTAVIGNVNEDNFINACDASDILVAFRRFREDYPSTRFTIDRLREHLSEYFPYAPCAEVVDTDKSESINNHDADNVLQFYSYVSTGCTVEEAYAELSVVYENYCGEEISVNNTNNDSIA